jgi:tryptophan synthase alpha chain
MSRIEKKFKALSGEGRKAFIPFITVGHPDLDTTERLIIELEKSGADIIELGVPFSDPMADGPIIQRASEHALKIGVSFGDCLDLVERLREKSEIPVVIFSYLNPLLAYGLDSLGERLHKSGIDAVLATDLVPEEAGSILKALGDTGIDTVFLVAPTSTDERIRLIAEAATGFVYAVSRAGVTGVRENLSGEAGSLVERVRRFTSLPVAVGFGVSTPDHVEAIWRVADAAVVGSRIVWEIESLKGAPDLVEKIGDLARWLVSARDEKSM